MSGVFGVLDSKRNSKIWALLTKMGTKMSHREWYVVETFCDESVDVGLGRIGIGIFNRERQPIYSEDRNLVVFLSGEFYSTAELRRDLETKGHCFRDDSDLELVLRLYEEKGEQFVHALEGAFIVMIWNRSRQEVIIANDRFGLYPLFYAHYDGKLVFAPEMKGILCDDTFPRKLDLTALAQYMRFQTLLGTRTFFEGIKLMPKASLLRYKLQSDNLTLEHYWDYSRIPEAKVTFDEAVEEAGRLLRQAVHCRCFGGHRIGVYLSGGLDSRTILGLIEKKHFPVVTITFGQKSCRDVILAARIARKVGSDHHWFELRDGNWVIEFADFQLTLTEGLHSWIHAHGISTLSEARQLMDVNLTGWDGGTIMGPEYSIEPLLVQAVDDKAFTTRCFYLLVNKWQWPGLDEAEEAQLYCHDFYPRIRGRAFESLCEELRDYLRFRPTVRSSYFYVDNLCRRWTFNMVTLARSHIEVRFPYFDYAFTEFIFSLPVKIRAGFHLYRSVIQKEIPKLAYIPYSRDGLPPTTQWLVRSAHASVLRLKNWINHHISPIFPKAPTLYADYENYLRADLRDWAEGILFDPRTTERGIFDPAFLRSLMNRHLSGLEEWTIGKIAPIMTYEMMLRRFYDGEL